MGQRKTKPVVTRTVADATPEGSIRRTAVTTGVDVDREYDAMNAPFGEGGGLFGMGNMPRARASLSQADLVAMRRQQRENYDMYTEDTRAQQRVAEARGVIRERRQTLFAELFGNSGTGAGSSSQGLFGPTPSDEEMSVLNELAAEALAGNQRRREAQATLDFFRETGPNADRRATEREIAEANAAGRRRREEVEQGRMVRARVEGSAMGAARR